ncbi:MAG: Protein of unknown function (DUF3078) [Bacteroidetes bacterium HLUCCA01]|nr:MAG: Protein of unknown function (DUF3078) [Bacteroidetes bacterium HLUCCA01]
MKSYYCTGLTILALSVLSVPAVLASAPPSADSGTQLASLYPINGVDGTHGGQNEIRFMAFDADLSLYSGQTGSDAAQEAQAEEQPEGPASPWTFGGWLTLNGSQAAFHNWAQGGVNNLTGVSSARFTAEYTRDRYVFNHSTNLKYGQSRLDGNEFRKTDDEIRLRNQIRRMMDDERFSLIAQVNFNSQFDIGRDKDNVNTISRFMAPAYIVETVGFAYNPDPSFQMDMGISMRQTVVTDTDLSTRYGLAEGETFRNEGGISIGVKTEREIMTNVVYNGQLETFTNLMEQLNSSTVRFTNELIGKVNSYLTVNVEVAFLYDDDVSTELQVKQVLSVGFSYRFL